MAPRRFGWVEETGLMGAPPPKPAALAAAGVGGTWNLRPFELGQRGLAWVRLGGQILAGYGRKCSFRKGRGPGQRVGRELSSRPAVLTSKSIILYPLQTSKTQDYGRGSANVR